MKGAVVSVMAEAGGSGAFEEALGALCRRVDAACAAAHDWPSGAAAAIAAALQLGAAELSVLRTLTVDVFDDGVRGARRYRRMVEDFAARLAAGREHCPDGPGEELPEVIEEALIGALAQPIASAVRSGRGAGLPALAPELIQFVLTPYVGAEEARRLGREHGWTGRDV